MCDGFWHDKMTRAQKRTAVSQETFSFLSWWLALSFRGASTLKKIVDRSWFLHDGDGTCSRDAPPSVERMWCGMTWWLCGLVDFENQFFKTWLIFSGFCPPCLFGSFFSCSLLVVNTSPSPVCSHYQTTVFLPWETVANPQEMYGAHIVLEKTHQNVVVRPVSFPAFGRGLLSSFSLARKTSSLDNWSQNQSLFYFALEVDPRSTNQLRLCSLPWAEIGLTMADSASGFSKRLWPWPPITFAITITLFSRVMDFHCRFLVSLQVSDDIWTNGCAAVELYPDLIFSPCAKVIVEFAKQSES